MQNWAEWVEITKDVLLPSMQIWFWIGIIALPATYYYEYGRTDTDTECFEATVGLLIMCGMIFIGIYSFSNLPLCINWIIQTFSLDVKKGVVWILVGWTIIGAIIILLIDLLSFDKEPYITIAYRIVSIGAVLLGFVGLIIWTVF